MQYTYKEGVRTGEGNKLEKESSREAEALGVRLQKKQSRLLITKARRFILDVHNLIRPNFMTYHYD